MTREPDYVVNVWSDGRVTIEDGSAGQYILTFNLLNVSRLALASRTRVFLKPSAQEKRE